jgi:hypothetical protein
MSPVNVNVKARTIAMSLCFGSELAVLYGITELLQKLFQLPQFVDHFIHAFSSEVLYMEVIMGESSSSFGTLLIFL